DAVPNQLRRNSGMPAAVAEFERDILPDRAKGGNAEARKRGGPHGRRPPVAKRTDEIEALAEQGLSKSASPEAWPASKRSKLAQVTMPERQSQGTATFHS